MKFMVWGLKNKEYQCTIDSSLMYSIHDCHLSRMGNNPWASRIAVTAMVYLYDDFMNSNNSEDEFLLTGELYTYNASMGRLTDSCYLELFSQGMIIDENGFYDTDKDSKCLASVEGGEAFRIHGRAYWIQNGNES